MDGRIHVRHNELVITTVIYSFGARISKATTPSSATLTEVSVLFAPLFDRRSSYYSICHVHTAIVPPSISERTTPKYIFLSFPSDDVFDGKTWLSLSDYANYVILRIHVDDQISEESETNRM